MPITRSAKKALRQSLRQHAGNLKKKEIYKRLVRDVKGAVDTGNKKEAEKLIPQLYRALDKAAKTNVIKKNKASRLKSRLSRLVQKQGK